MGLNSFSIKEHLKKSNAIKAVLDKGVCFRSKTINICALKRVDSDVNRAAFICKKSLCQKKAVLRNRFRRILKEAYRKSKHFLPPGHDIVVVGTRVTKDTKSLEIEKEITDVFKKYIKK
ncbi:MAG: ribonuclease P protein component [Candidatus Omnitrophota bacterium]|nr:ribonuclease P protein component [Candidatus Omnitrophota bacterium]